MLPEPYVILTHWLLMPSLSLAFSVPTGHGKEHSAPTGYSSCLSLAYSIPTGDMGRNILHPLATHAVLFCLQRPHGGHGEEHSASVGYSCCPLWPSASPWGTWAGLVGLDTQPWKPFQYYDSVCFVLSPDALALLLFATWEGQSGCEQGLHPTSCCFPRQPQLPEVSGGITERLAEQPYVLTWFLSDPLVTSVPASTQFRSVIQERPPTQGSEEERMTTEENAKRQGPGTFALRDSD